MGISQRNENDRAQLCRAGSGQPDRPAGQCTSTRNRMNGILAMTDSTSEPDTKIKLRDYLREDLIFPRHELATQMDVFELVNDVALKHGYVNEKFLPKIIAREKTYPTGLELEHGAVAIPHTDADTIVKEFVAVVTSTTPVAFQRMDNPKEQVQTNLVFVLGLNKPHAQVKMLQQLASIIQDQGLMKKIEGAASVDAVIEVLS